jgi:hypothetical protein
MFGTTFFADNVSSSAGAPAVALISSVADSGETDASVTTPAINTTGATLLVVMVSSATTSPTLSDSKSNSWNALNIATSAGGQKGQLYYASSPTVGAGHTFTAAGVNTFPAVAVLAFSNVKLVSPFDQQNTSNTSQPGSITPSQSNEVIVTGLHVSNLSVPPSIDSGFSVPVYSLHAGGVSYGVAISYLVQTSAAAINPTWNAGADTYATTIASFKNG